jgi:hypothetical protein
MEARHRRWRLSGLTVIPWNVGCAEFAASVPQQHHPIPQMIDNRIYAVPE